MAYTWGTVHYVSMGAYPNQLSKACTYIGPSPSKTEIFYVLSDKADTADMLAFKMAMVNTLVAAMVSHMPVRINHGDTDANIKDLVIAPEP